VTTSGTPDPNGPSARLSPHLARREPASLRDHRAAFPPPPIARREPLAELIDDVDTAGLRGRGGAAFPTAVKMRAVAGGRRRPVVVVNGSEGEPASRKDSVLMTLGPHLVLDGAELAAAAVGADEVIVGVDAASPHALRSIAAALRERSESDRAGVNIRIVRVPSGYVAGEERSLVHLLNGGPAIPTSGPRPFVRGVRSRPTLIQNVETLGHLALINAFGPTWFRAIGPHEMPGSMLVTVSGGVGSPGVFEIEVGTTLAEVISGVGGVPQGVGGVLVGGYSGTWLGPEVADTVALHPKGLAAVGGILGAGVVAVIPEGACGWSETASVMRWLAGQTAGQCGPCVHGLAAIAGAAEQVVSGRGGDATLGRLARWVDDVPGRGACGLPDGAVRLLRSALEVFGADVRAHLRGRRCAGSRWPRILPVPQPGEAA
jgi:NADH:ubiquinone oxidoreductase subunit F (NADH-binding)